MSKHLKEDPETLAKEAIKLLERKLAQEYKVVVQWGAELEYSFVPRVDKPLDLETGPVNILRMSGHDRPTKFFPNNHHRKPLHEVEYAVDEQADLDKKAVIGKGPSGVRSALIRVHDALLPDSPYVSYTYEEDPPGQMESVVGHQGARFEKMRPDGNRSLLFARVIESLRHTLETSHEKTGLITDNPLQDKILRRLREDWKISTEPRMTTMDKERNQGMHINLSVHRYNPAKPKRQRSEATIAIPGEFLQRDIANVFNEGAYLMLASNSALEREKFRNEYRDEMGIIDLDPRLEIKRPPMDANPYYTVMLSLIGIYQGLKTHQYTPEGKYDDTIQSPALYHAIPQNFDNPDSIRAFMKNRFNNGSAHLIRDALNDVLGGLGNRFEAALEHTPPGQERSSLRRPQTERG